MRFCYPFKTPIVWLGVLHALGRMALAHAATPEIEVIGQYGQYGQPIGSGDAASQGVIGAEQVRERALLRPAELLETIPGMVVTQHSGDGKAKDGLHNPRQSAS